MFPSASVYAVMSGSGVLALLWIGLIALWLERSDTRMDIPDLDFLDSVRWFCEFDRVVASASRVSNRTMKIGLISFAVAASERQPRLIPAIRARRTPSAKCPMRYSGGMRGITGISVTPYCGGGVVV
jgi:hypothetical protein